LVIEVVDDAPPDDLFPDQEPSIPEEAEAESTIQEENAEFGEQLVEESVAEEHVSEEKIAEENNPEEAVEEEGEEKSKVSSRKSEMVSSLMVKI
jgi:hypothetical protein